MQKWQIFAKDFAKERVDYPFLAMTANANSQCERTFKRLALLAVIANCFW